MACPSAVAAPFVARLPLRFAHCDPAGIAYYPRYLELCDAAIEDWTAATLGVGRRAMHLDQRLGLPTVELSATFLAPGILGDLLHFAITVREVGRSSALLATEVTCAGAPRFRAEHRVVLTCLETMKAAPWPEAWRRHLLAAAGLEIAA